MLASLSPRELLQERHDLLADADELLRLREGSDPPDAERV